MELRDAIRRRRMVRAYDPDRPVPPDVVDRLLEHAVRSPSAGFSQGWDFLVLETSQERDLFWRSTTEPATDPGSWLRGLMSAPLLVVCLSHKDAYLDRYAEPDKGWTDRDEARWPVPYWDVDTGMAALLMLLTAVDEGLGSCFFGVPPEHHDSVRTAVRRPGRPLPRRRRERRARGRGPQEPEPATRPARTRAGGARRPVRRALPPRPVEHRGRARRRAVGHRRPARRATPRSTAARCAGKGWCRARPSRTSWSRPRAAPGSTRTRSRCR